MPLRLLSTTHEISAPYDVQRLQTRIDELKKHLPEILERGKIDRDIRQKVIPSGSAVIRAARDPDGHYYVFDGNGRTQALRAALGKEHSQIKVEVEVYDIADKDVVREIRDSQKRRKGTEFPESP